jgi:hypothetical protein
MALQALFVLCSFVALISVNVEMMRGKSTVIIKLSIQSIRRNWYSSPSHIYDKPLEQDNIATMILGVVRNFDIHYPLFPVGKFLQASVAWSGIHT